MMFITGVYNLLIFFSNDSVKVDIISSFTYILSNCYRVIQLIDRSFVNLIQVH